MKYTLGIAAFCVLALGACSQSEPAATEEAPAEAAMAAPETDSDATTDTECTPPNCDTGGNGRPVEEIGEEPQR